MKLVRIAVLVGWTMTWSVGLGAVQWIGSGVSASEERYCVSPPCGNPAAMGNTDAAMRALVMGLENPVEVLPSVGFMVELGVTRPERRIEVGEWWPGRASGEATFAESEDRLPLVPEGQSLEVVVAPPSFLRVPEPSSPWLVVLGLVVLALRSQRRPAPVFSGVRIG
jgi:hypothetical protein